TSVRWLLRPIILQLQPWPGSFAGRASIAHPLLFTFASTFLVALLNLFQLAVMAEASHDPEYTIKFGQIALFYFVMGLALFYYVTLQFRRELRGLVRNIRGLVGGRKQLSGKMPVISHDEAGELAVAFNELQSRIDREYESLERELKLAYNVQQKLLPPGDLTIGSYRIAARCQPYREVGGDFFDVVSLSPGRFAVMIGDVSGKGMPAALLMSALLLLFRAEIRRNGNPAKVLQRMNRQICEAMGNEGSVSIGVGVIDLTADTVQYASAGHLSPYIVKADGGVRAVDCSSLPIGFDAEAAYEEISLQLHPGDRFVLYTDGLIEAVDEEGQMYSFEGLEAELSTWKANEDIVRLVDSWLKRMDQR
ncbi:SpoIIE family protein phosphatase, partial [Paenibacillus sepulcri]|nr:SpoIIE family protein phosphatase [Paenibacillus sepulcri]